MITKGQMRQDLGTLVEELRGALLKEKMLVGFIQSINCWDIFVKANNPDNPSGCINLDELKRAVNNIKCDGCSQCEVPQEEGDKNKKKQ